MMVYIETMTFAGGSVDGYIERGSETERVCTQETRTMYICTGPGHPWIPGGIQEPQGDSRDTREATRIPGRLQVSQGNSMDTSGAPGIPGGLQGIPLGLDLPEIPEGLQEMMVYIETMTIVGGSVDEYRCT